MKRFLIIVMAFMALPVFAEPQQDIKNEQTYFTANLQKQPEKQDKQKISNHFTFFTINVQINRQIKDTADSIEK